MPLAQFEKKGFRLIAKGHDTNMFRTMEEQSQSTAHTANYSLNMAVKIIFYFIERINMFFFFKNSICNKYEYVLKMIKKSLIKSFKSIYSKCKKI